MADQVPVIVFVRDLMFSGRILAEARAQHAAVKVVRDAARLSDEAGARLIVDLNQEGALEAAVAWKARHGGKVIGFASHVDVDTIVRAREQGIDQVLSRGQFSQNLAALLQSQVKEKRDGED